ncbi:MAG: OprO/OprP family phosphate-selective porin [Candidatus Marinimicrobia bacterium]|nr:OprO/OprP family phosphate-selective porin [Candidatus Neomarinimicrobiota bacterium]
MKAKFFISAILLCMTNLMGAEAKLSGDTHFHFTMTDLENTEFGISRAYLTYENKVNEHLSYKFQTDIGSGGATAYTVFLKNAKIDWKTEMGKLTFGLQGMNMFNIQEGNWGYRFLEKSAMDRKGYSSSADLGIGIESKIGPLSVSAMLTNGAGYKKAEDDQYKKISTRLLYGESKLDDGFNAGVVLSYEAMDYTAVHPVSMAPITEQGNTIVYGGFGAAAFGPIRVGCEYSMQTVNTASTSSSNLLSVYANYDLSKKLAAFARADVYGSDVEGKGENYVILGANYSPEKQLSIAPNVMMISPEGEDSEMTYRVSFRFKF